MGDRKKRVVKTLLAALLCTVMLPVRVAAAESIVPFEGTPEEILPYDGFLDEAAYEAILTEELTGAAGTDSAGTESAAGADADEEILVFHEDEAAPAEMPLMRAAGVDTGLQDSGELAATEDTMPAGLSPVQFVWLPEEYLDETEPEITGELDGAQYNDPYWDQFTSYYIYNQLSDAEKTLYDNLNKACVGVLNGTKDYTTNQDTIPATGKTIYPIEKVAFPGSLGTDAALEVTWLFFYENPQYYFIANRIGYGWSGSSYWIQLYCYDDFSKGSARKTATQQVKSKLDSWISEVRSQSTVVEKEKKAQDVIGRDTEYRLNSDLDQSVYSAIVNGVSVCAGYSGSYHMLLNAAGIDSCVVTGQNHAFVIARVNGTWYYVDPTWADTAVTNEWFNRDTAHFVTGSQRANHQAESRWKSFLPDFPLDSGGSVSGTPNAMGSLPAPVITQEKAGSSYRISITCLNPSAEIWYTSDKQTVMDPGVAYSKSTKYTGTFTAAKGVTVKAVAQRQKYDDSVISTAVVGTEAPAPNVPVTGVSLDRPNLVLSIGASATLTATIVPANASDQSISWKSDNPSIATVNSSGRVTGRSEGDTFISVTTNDGGYIDRCYVSVLPNPVPPVPGGDVNWSADTVIRGKDGSSASLRVSLTHTGSVIYDGRKHVVRRVGTKTVKETASVNPDIAVSDFTVTIDGEELDGIDITSYSYRNNMFPSYDGVTDQAMYVFPVLKYDRKSAVLKWALNAYPTLKTALNKLVKPAYNSKRKTWASDPITLDIKRIELTSGTPVYTTQELKTNKSLQTMDGILVWNNRVNGSNARYTGWLTKVQFVSLYYQRAFSLPNGKIAVKKLYLRNGVWHSYYNKNTKEGRQVMQSTAFDYYPQAYYYFSIPESGVVSFPIQLNGDDADWSKSNPKAKRGYFTGTFPEIQVRFW